MIDLRQAALKKLADLGQEIEQEKRGSIALARQLCYEIAGATSEDDDISGHDYGSVDIAEILSAEVVQLREALAQLEQQAEPVSHAVIAGALFDFMGWLTSRKERLVLSSADEAGPAVEAITAFSKMRGLSLDDAKVQDWQDYTAPPQQQAEPPPEWESIKNILDEYGLDAIAFVAAWKAAQRPWQGLTPDEVKHLYPYGRSVWGRETFEAIEKALKEKNT